jgi:hypothetical protein
LLPNRTRSVPPSATADVIAFNAIDSLVGPRKTRSLCSSRPFLSTSSLQT